MMFVSLRDAQGVDDGLHTSFIPRTHKEKSSDKDWSIEELSGPRVWGCDGIAFNLQLACSDCGVLGSNDVGS